ncbi:FAD dependent oxidoreductase [Rhodococcus opacus M213]|uniref:FAD dependent oxidoreductase n=1 Tax=Rhodococcus opacus M213 TaxID=1129896 RepID=K8XPW7_RHOOP|nr:FAD-dependent oxidoreductase [Rhodococcus opacus]EKT79080.1 FAD dependent oxidoreductase [Rhodococcus opacus M213]
MTPNVLVIGAGVIGCSLAFELTRRGAAVTVVDSAEVMSGTSSATFGWINANKKKPVEYELLNMLGLEAHERARDERNIGTADWFHQIGSIELAASTDSLAALEEKVSQLASRGYKARILTRAEVESAEPSLDVLNVAGGALYPKEGWIDALTMCSHLMNAARAQGATFKPFRRVIGLTLDGETTMSTADGLTESVKPDVTILAAGNGNRPILASAGIGFPTRPTLDWASTGHEYPSVGIITTTSPVDAGIRHMIHSPGVAIRPARNGGVTLTDAPTGAQWSHDDPRVWGVPTLLLERAQKLYPSLKSTTTENVTLGTRVLPDDGVTIADWVGEEQKVYAIATHSGVTLAGHLADAVASEVLDGTRHESLGPFGLDRFAS